MTRDSRDHRGSFRFPSSSTSGVLETVNPATRKWTAVHLPRTSAGLVENRRVRPCTPAGIWSFWTGKRWRSAGSARSSVGRSEIVGNRGDAARAPKPHGHHLPARRTGDLAAATRPRRLCCSRAVGRPADHGGYG